MSRLAGRWAGRKASRKVLHLVIGQSIVFQQQPDQGYSQKGTLGIIISPGGHQASVMEVIMRSTYRVSHNS